MDGFLKISTAYDLRVGPFLDDTDGKSAETGLTVTQAEVRLSKNGGDMAQKNEATSLVHDELGYYILKLDATDTNTVGMLKVMIYESGALPVWHNYQVMPAIIYDSLFAAAATDYLPVDIVQYNGTAAHAAVTAGIIPVDIHQYNGTDTHAAVTAGIIPTDVHQWLGTDAHTAATAGVPYVDVHNWLGAAAPAMTGDAYAEAVLVHAHVADCATATLQGTIHTDVDEILTRVPDATAGANGGLTICGANAATTFATLTVTGQLLAGTMSVTGQLDAGNLLVDGTTVLTGTVGTGALTMASTTVTGALLAATMSVTGQLDAGNFLVDGTTVLTGAVTMGATAVNITGNITGNLSGTVGSVTGAVGSVTTKTGYELAATGADLILKSSTFALAIADAVWDEVITSANHAVADSSALYVRNLYQSVVTRIAQCGDAGGATTIDLDAAASAVNDYYKGQVIAICGGTGAGQARVCTSYVGATNVATISPAWATNPDGDSWFAVLNVGSVVVAALADGSITAASIATDAIDADALAADAVAEIWAHVGTVTSLAVELLLERCYEMLNNKMIITEATGNVALRNLADGADVATGNVADLGATTVRSVLTWV